MKESLRQDIESLMEHMNDLFETAEGKAERVDNNSCVNAYRIGRADALFTARMLVKDYVGTHLKLED